jgi:GT2 family glycosyltransferase
MNPAGKTRVSLADEGEMHPSDIEPHRTVAAIVVVTEPSAELASTLIALRNQQPPLTILVVDDASAVDPTPIVADASPSAFVSRLSVSVGWAAAANAGADQVQGAAWLLICHDDVAPAPDAVRSMVDTAIEHHADIVTPKLVAWSNHERLRSVGYSSDRSAKAITRVEFNELDQGQHDFAQQVSAAHGACLLVRSDAFRSVGGFDEAMTAMKTSPSKFRVGKRSGGLTVEQQQRLTESLTGPELGEDLDLCWRIIRRGGSAVVDPNARVAHADRRHRISDANRNDSRSSSDTYELDPAVRALRLLAGRRNRIRSVSSVLSGTSMLRGLLGLFIQRLALSRTTLPFPAVRHLVPRSGVSSLRKRRIVVRSATRSSSTTAGSVSIALEPQLSAGDVTLRKLIRNEFAKDSAQAFSLAGGAVSVGWRRGPIRLVSGMFVLVSLSILVGSRKILDGVGSHGQFVRIPGVSTLLRAYGSPARELGLTNGAPSPPGLLVATVARLVGLGTNWWTGFFTTTAMIPVGIVGAARLGASIARSIARASRDTTARTDLNLSDVTKRVTKNSVDDRAIGVLSAALSGALYGATPVAINSLRAGSWEALLLFAALPWLIHIALRLGGELDARGASGMTNPTTIRQKLLNALRMGLPLAVVGSVAPVAVTVTCAVMAFLFLGAAIAGNIQEGASPAEPERLPETDGSNRSDRSDGSDGLPNGSPLRTVTAFASGLVVCIGLFTAWVTELVRSPTILRGRGPTNTAMSVLEILKLSSRANLDSRFGVGGWLSLGLPIAATLTLLLVNNRRLWWALRFWMFGVGFGAAMWSVDRGPFVGLLPSHEVLAVPAALGLVMVVTIGISGVAQDIRRASFGWRQSATLGAVAAVVLSVIPVAWSARSGDWRATTSAARNNSQWLVDSSPATDAESRPKVLWIGDANGVDGESHVFAAAGSSTPIAQRAYWNISGLSGPELTGYWAGNPRDATVGRLLQRVADRSTFRVGTSLNESSIRYIVISATASAGASGTDSNGASASVDLERIVSGIDQQLDLREVQRNGSLRIMENVAWTAQPAPATPKTQNAWTLMRWLQLFLWTAAGFGFLLDWSARRRRLDDLVDDRDTDAAGHKLNRTLSANDNDDNEDAWDASLTVQGAFRSEDDLYAEVFDDTHTSTRRRAVVSVGKVPDAGADPGFVEPTTDNPTPDAAVPESLADQMWNEWSERRSRGEEKS